MFLSTFSHYSAFHLFANMYVLHSFSNAAILSLGKEQFLAVYMSAGVVASLASILYKALTVQAGLSIGAVNSKNTMKCFYNIYTYFYSLALLWPFWPMFVHSIPTHS